MIKYLKTLFHIHKFIFVEYTDHWVETCGLRSIEQCRCGKRRKKIVYSCSCRVGTIYEKL